MKIKQLKIRRNNYAKRTRVQIRLDKIEKCKKEKGTKKHRKLQKYSQKFDEIFLFFLKSYRAGILTFCGYGVKVDSDLNSDDGKFSFRKFENGEMKIHNLVSRHPNILKGVIAGKKSWGLWKDQFIDGILEWSFTKEEVLMQFKEKNIKIPDSFLLDFDNTLFKRQIKRNEIEMDRLKEIGLL